jgi:hypothetical protein
VQEEMWMCVYDNDYQPARPQEKRCHGEPRLEGGRWIPWAQPFKADTAGSWQWSADSSTEFSLDTQSGSTPLYLRYNPSQGNDFRATYAYDASVMYPQMPVCSDLMMRCYVKIGSGRSGHSTE